MEGFDARRPRLAERNVRRSKLQNADSPGGIEGSIEFFQWNADAGMYAWPGYDGISPFLAQYHLAPVKVSNVSRTGKLTSVDSLTETGSATRNSPPNCPPLPLICTMLLRSSSISGAKLSAVSSFNLTRRSSGRDRTIWRVRIGSFQTAVPRSDPLHIAPHATGYGPKSAFRYALVRFTGGKNIRYKSIQLDGIDYPVTYKGYFSSSDPELNQMWTIGAYTAHLCMQDDIWDAPKRDRGRWMGDLDVSGSTIEDAFDDHFLMEETLDRLLGAEPIRKDVNGIPGYSAFWIIGEAEYYRHTGSIKQLESIHTRLVQLLHYMETELDQRNLYANEHHIWPFVDWSPELSGDTPESRRATQFEFYAAFREAHGSSSKCTTPPTPICFSTGPPPSRQPRKSTFSIRPARSAPVGKRMPTPYCPASPTPRSIPLSGRRVSSV